MIETLSGAFGAFFANLFTAEMLFALLLGVVGGMVIGALPGLSATMGIALLTPLTYSMSPIPALTMLTSIYTSAIMGGSFTAILVHSPGTTSSAATLIDGYQMTQQGRALKALGTSITASCIGGIISAVVLLFLAPPLASVSLAFNAAEYFLLGCFGLSVIASLSSDSMAKGLVSGCLGLVLSCVGTDALSAFPRYTFGSMNLLDGFNSTAALIGLFSVGQMLCLVEGIRVGSERQEKKEFAKIQGSIFLTIKEFVLILPTVVRSALIGVAVGILPGAGGSIGSFIAYNEGKRFAKDKEHYGKGSIEGVAAPEAANNAVTGGAMIPLLTLGIPGSPAAAVLLGGLLIHGLVPGSSLFTTQATTTYAIIIGFLFANVIMMPVGFLLARFMGNVVKIPQSVLAAVIVVLSVVGAYSIRNNMFDVYVMIGFGFLGYIITKTKYLSSALVLGLLLGYMAESGLRKSLTMSRGDVFGYYLSRPACLVLIVLILASVVWPLVSRQLRARKAAKGAS